MQQPAARPSAGGWAAAAREASAAGGRRWARSDWTAAGAASSAVRRWSRVALLWGGGGHRRVAVAGAVALPPLPGLARRDPDAGGGRSLTAALRVAALGSRAWGWVWALVPAPETARSAQVSGARTQ